MARRRAGKAKPRSAVAREAPGRRKTSDLRERLAAVERERDQLRAALDVEQARRRKLEEVHATARDRIAWALDSLQSILDSKR
jgi:hypothetical protein